MCDDVTINDALKCNNFVSPKMQSPRCLLLNIIFYMGLCENQLVELLEELYWLLVATCDLETYFISH